MKHLLLLGSKLSFLRNLRILYTACGIHRFFLLFQGVEDILGNKWKMVSLRLKLPRSKNMPSGFIVWPIYKYGDKVGQCSLVSA